MTKQQLTPFYTDTYAIDYHRKLGSRCYGLDIDMIEQTYENGKIKFITAIDYKHGNSYLINTSAAPIQAQFALTDQLSIGFFICITYLDPADFPIPMYFLIPMNDLARKLLQGYERHDNGTWFSIKEYSKFQHLIRNLEWNENETDKNSGDKLSDLSEQIHHYRIPKIS